MRNDEDVFTRGGNQADPPSSRTASEDAGNQWYSTESGQRFGPINRALTSFVGNAPEQPKILLAEHDRAMRALAEEIGQLRRERIHAADVLRVFREAPLSISSVQPILTLADALCGPKETPCPPTV